MRIRYFIILLLLLLPFIFRDYTPNNELRYVSIVEEALQNHTWFTFYNHGEVYADKPPLYFWLMMGGRMLTGGYPMGVLGLLSLLPMVGIMAVMDRWIRFEYGRTEGWLPDLMLATTGIFVGSALVVRMDMLMTFFIVLSLYTFYKIYRQKDLPRDRWLLPVYIFLAVFTKGPVGLLLPLVAIVAFLLMKKQIRTIHRYFGWTQLGVLCGLLVLWFVLIYQEGGREYLDNILFKQTIGRGINSFHHQKPFYFYVVRFVFTFAPWSLLYIAVLFKGGRRRFLKNDLEQFFFVIIFASLGLLSVVSSKLDIYLLPVYPFVVYLSVLLLRQLPEGRLLRACVAVPAIIFVLLFPVSFFALERLPYAHDTLLALRLGLLLVSLGGGAALYFIRKKRLGLAIEIASLGILTMVCIASWDIPQFNAQIGLGKLAQRGAELAHQQNIDTYAFYKFRSGENMDIYLDKPLRKIESVEELEAMEHEERQVLFVGYRELRHEPALSEWLSAHKDAQQVGDYYVLTVGR